MNTFQVFLIVNFYTTQIVFDNNEDLNKLVKTIKGWKFDYNRQKWYIPSSKTHFFTNLLSLNGINWAVSQNNNSSSKLAEYVKRAKIYNENSFDISLNEMIHRGFIQNMEHLDHIKRENTIRVHIQSKYSVVVALPISSYSFSVLSNLKKAYSIDGFGWVFVGEENIRNLYETCKNNQIYLIEEGC